MNKRSETNEQNDHRDWLNTLGDGGHRGIQIPQRPTLPPTASPYYQPDQDLDLLD